jgi:hypothetical protein
VSTRESAIVQGLYYAITGVWPLISMRSFEAVTGPKIDKWLVQTVGVLVTSIGVVLAAAGIRRSVQPELAALAVSSAAGLAGIDFVYASTGRISKVYLVDAAVEVLLIVAWTLAQTRRRD